MPSNDATNVLPGSGGERSEPPGKRSAQRPKGAEARGIAAEIGAKRRLQRKARSRSDAPGFIVAFGTAFANVGNIGGIDRIATGSVVVGNGSTVVITTADIVIGTSVRIGVGVGIGGGAGSMSSSFPARW